MQRDNRRRDIDILDSETPPLLLPSTWQGEVDVARDLMPELFNMKILGKVTLAVPLLTKLDRAATVIPVAQAPVTVLARLKGFAECLDDPVLDVVPVTPRVHPAMMVDPLPWEQ